MSRKRKPLSEWGVNLDSLMDALTNVVAVLILVLLLVQADVSNKVVEFLENLEPATPEQVTQSRQDLVKLEIKLKDRKDLENTDAPTPEVLEAEKRRLALLEKTIKDNQDLLADFDQVRKLEMKLRKDRDAEQTVTSVIQKEIARLEALLDATPELKAPPPQIVTIPKSRPIPSNADVYYALVFGDRVHLIDPITPLQKFMKEFGGHKREWQDSRIKRQGRDRYIYNQTKIVAHFKDFDFKNPRGQSVKVIPNPMGTRLYIDIKPDGKAGGTSNEELEQGDSSFGKAMEILSRKQRAVLMFWVHPNSFNTYLVARRFADKAGVPAGWEVKGNTSYRVLIADVEVKRLKDPPPPDPNAKPKPRPPALKPKLD